MPGYVSTPSDDRHVAGDDPQRLFPTDNTTAGRRRGSSEIPKRKEPNCLESDSVYGDLQNRLGRKNRPQVRRCEQGALSIIFADAPN